MLFQIHKPQNKTPFTLHMLFGIFLFLALWQVVSLLFLPKATIEASDLTISNILNGVNQERSLRNLNTLNSDTRLASAAQYKSDDMQERHYFSHTDPDGQYIWNKIISAGYTPYLQLGENLAIEFTNTESLVLAWMNSPTHRANILNESFQDQGMGLTFGEPQNGEYYSAIANTFGALVPQKKTDQPAQKVESQTTPPPQETKAPTPAPVKTPEQPITEPITQKTETSPPSEPLRDTAKQLAQDTRQEPNFSLPQNEQPPASSATQSGDAVLPSVESTKLSAYDINRYAMLGVGAILLVMVLADLKKILGDKLNSYDKKINNLVLLLLSLLVIGLLYWL